jgi:hypothetical protein
MTRTVRTWLLLLLLAVVVNLPLVHSTWTDARVEGAGADVTAQVTGHRESGSDHWVSFMFSEEVDPEQRTWTAEVDEDTYDDAVASGEIGVRVVEDDPAAYRVDGEVESNAVLFATIVADIVLLIAFLLFWRFRGRLGHVRADLRAVALEDVVRCPPGVLLDRLHAEDYLIQGEVHETGPDSVVLDLGNRLVVVLLDGHANPVGYQQSAQVRARMIG